MKIPDQNPRSVFIGLVVIASLFFIYLFVWNYQLLGSRKGQDLFKPGETNFPHIKKNRDHNANHLTINENKSFKKIIDNKKEADSPPVAKSIDDLAKLYSRQELVLLRECSRTNLDLNLVRIFLAKSKNMNNRQELMDLAKSIGANDFRLKLELVRYVNKKVTPQQIEKNERVKFPNEKENISKSIFQKIIKGGEQ